MKHSGRAAKAGHKLIWFALAVEAALVGGGALVAGPGVALRIVAPVVVLLWILFTAFTLYFFRDPIPNVPAEARIVVSPAHATVDVIDTVSEPDFMGGTCQRISMFLSVFDVHVQNAPVGGKLAFSKHTPGKFLNAMKTESAEHNENLLLGFLAEDSADAKVGVRLIAGAIARRIVPFTRLGETVDRGDRISLIQFGSRADVYLPAGARLRVKLGDKVVGGETVLAVLA